jgi:hypothetical protein
MMSSFNFPLFVFGLMVWTVASITLQESFDLRDRVCNVVPPDGEEISIHMWNSDIYSSIICDAARFMNLADPGELDEESAVLLIENLGTVCGNIYLSYASENDLMPGPKRLLMDTVDAICDLLRHHYADARETLELSATLPINDSITLEQAFGLRDSVATVFPRLGEQISIPTWNLQINRRIIRDATRFMNLNDPGKLDEGKSGSLVTELGMVYSQKESAELEQHGFIPVHSQVLLDTVEVLGNLLLHNYPQAGRNMQASYQSHPRV